MLLSKKILSVSFALLFMTINSYAGNAISGNDHDDIALVTRDAEAPEYYVFYPNLSCGLMGSKAMPNALAFNAYDESNHLFASGCWWAENNRINAILELDNGKLSEVIRFKPNTLRLIVQGDDHMNPAILYKKTYGDREPRYSRVTESN